MDDSDSILYFVSFTPISCTFMQFDVSWVYYVKTNVDLNQILTESESYPPRFLL